jgi:hypothetical protein
MEFIMTGFHLAVIVAIIVTASLASNLLAIATVGPARTQSGALVRLRLGLRRSPRHMKRLVDSWVAAMLVRRERQSATWASARLHGRGEASPRNIRFRSGRPR